MIIVDLNQVMLSNLLMQIGNHTNAELEENMVRHMVLNSLRSYRIKFKEEYGELVIACDNTNYWRKQIFPYYKANRKKNIENSELDWKNIFECLNKIRQELKDHFPYKVVDVESAEADDVIATLVKEYGMLEESLNFNQLKREKILILSGDKDFIQLQVYTNVSQYDPIRKKWIKHEDPKKFLHEHILKGDAGDGVPNVLSADNVFVVGERQRPLTAKRIEKILSTDLDNMDTTLARNYSRNAHLIDLNFVPDHITNKILDQYKSQEIKDRSKLLNYFIAKKLKNLTENLGDF